MSSPLRLLTCLLALTLAVTARASDPAGTWTFTTPGRDGQTHASTLVLAWDGERLTGHLRNRAGDAELRDVSFVDGHLRFSVKRRIRFRSLVVRYEGVLDGDTLRGTIAMTRRRDDTEVSLPWEAFRVVPASSERTSTDR